MPVKGWAANGLAIGAMKGGAVFFALGRAEIKAVFLPHPLIKSRGVFLT